MIIQEKVVDHLTISYETNVVHYRVATITRDDATNEEVAPRQFWRIALSSTSDLSAVPDNVKAVCAVVWPQT